MGHGALIHLAAQGVEDVDLVTDARFTFWKAQYSKHTAFALEPKEITSSSGGSGFGNKQSFQLKREGDLVADMWMVFDLSECSTGWRWTNDIGRAAIQEAQLKIGGVVFDCRFSEYTHAYEELTVPDELHLNELSGKSEVDADLETWGQRPQRIYAPVRFWFTESYSNALPLVGLYQHDATVEITWRSVGNVTHQFAPGNAAATTGGLAVMSKIHLLVEFAFLENNERNYFARGTHKYMINQVQHIGTSAMTENKLNFNVDLNYNHPTSQLLWFFRANIYDAGAGDLVLGVEADTNNYFRFIGTEPAPYVNDWFTTMRLMLNNTERFSVRDPLYFRKVQPRRHHTRIPRKHIYSYSFALHPEQAGRDPSGHINFSRIDNSQIRFVNTENLAGSLFVYAESVNWLKIERGLAKLFYA